MPVKSTSSVLPPARQEHLCELAEEIVSTHCIGSLIEPKCIADANGITHSFGSYGDAFDGMLEHKAGHFHIYLNQNRLGHIYSPRSRFTFAHELGHYYIDEHRLALQSGRVPAHGSKSEFESKNLVEQEADFFASSLLMPPSRFLPSAKKAAKGLEGILKLSDSFSVSITSAANKYCNLNLIPCAIIKWNPNGYSWKRLSTETFRQQFRKTIENKAQIPHRSATERAFKGETPPPEGFFQCGSVASAWFPYISSGSFRDVILIEQAISLKKFGVLTFLYPESGIYQFEATF